MNTITLAVKLRGVTRERSRLEEKSVHFRTVLKEIELVILVIILKKGGVVYKKGGEGGIF